MARRLTAAELSREIKDLARSTTTRIVRLSPAVADAYVRLIRRSGGDPVLVAAVDRYLAAARRMERHADPATRALFSTADDILTRHLSTASGPDVELLRLELAQRRLAMLGDPAALRDKFLETTRSRRRPSRDGADPAAAFLQQGFFLHVRAVAARGSSRWTAADRRLLRGRRKLSSALGPQWATGWEPAFAYLRENAVNIAARGRELRAAQEAIERAHRTGDVAAGRAAQAALTRARQSTSGYLSKVKGLLGEAYAPAWREWTLQVDGFLEVARRQARAMPGNHSVQRVVGNLRIDGKECWDEAILIVDRDSVPPLARLFLAAQFKVEKDVTALAQVKNDVLRENAHGSADSLPRLTLGEGKEAEAFQLVPMPAGTTAHRYVFNASGGTVRPSAIRQLQAAGIEVNQLNLDISLDELDAVAEAMMRVVVDTVP